MPKFFLNCFFRTFFFQNCFFQILFSKTVFHTFFFQNHFFKFFFLLSLSPNIILNLIVRVLIKNSRFRTRHYTHTNMAFSTEIGNKYRMLLGRKVDLTDFPPL